MRWIGQPLTIMNWVETNKITFEKLSDNNQLCIFKTIKKHSDEMAKIEEDVQKQVEFLKENGFVDGVHFSWKYSVITRVDFVYYEQGNERFFFEYKAGTASISINYKVFNGSSDMSNYKACINVLNDGLIREYGNVMRKTGSYKPKTILDRINFLNELADNEEAEYKKRISSLEFTMNEYASKYPTAKVTTHKNYNWRNNNYNSNADVIQVLFPSGSYVNIVVTNKVADVIKSHDAEAKILTLSETLDKFSQQEPIGVKETA